MTERATHPAMKHPERIPIGNRIAPWRFILFGILLCAAIPAAAALMDWRHAVLAGFDAAAIGFLLSIVSLFRVDAQAMRTQAQNNDANRFGLLLITATISLVVLVTIASVMLDRAAPDTAAIVLIIGTLLIAWIFANTVFALHYGHLFYLPHGKKDQGGLDFPGTIEPDYSDFLYFSFTLGMTFQTSDVTVSGRHMRRIMLLQSIAAFIFNIGILAFTINALGS
ncbi:DUF1345 domain-containing protein [Sphingobium boeckii]|uniref:Putative membrane protein n=1 Tax=Sphingobium boeckii TaxID=1082345 RepID=A0A7W9AEY1_9SPHN|nr:DUF1345 domain-containing protein [Sphingobium boeckii]MBB5684251.1 putative membrane protein [Sphingobium boeckii]